MLTTIVDLDLNNPMCDYLTAKQDDVGSRFIHFKLWNGLEPFSLTNRTIKVFMSKPDGTMVYSEVKKINDTGECELELTSQSLAKEGFVKCELAIYENNNKLTSQIFSIKVIKSINNDNAIESTNEFSALTKAMSQIGGFQSQLDNISINLLNSGGKINDKTIDNSIFINNSFNKGTTVYIPEGIFYCKSKITIPFGKKLLLSQKAELVLINNDVDFIEFRGESKLEGGKIKVSVSNYTSKALWINGNAKIDNGYIKDTIVISQDENENALYGGIGIGIIAEGDLINYVSFFSFNNVKVQYFNIGILLDTDSNVNNYVNGNLFNDIKLVGSITCLQFGTESTRNCICNGNKFNNIQFQDINAKTSTMLLINGGSQNVFTNVHFWDIQTGNHAININKFAMFNYIEHNLAYKHDEVIIGSWEENRNIQTITGYYKDLMPFDVGTKNIGTSSNEWNSIFAKNINASQSIHVHGILENKSDLADNGDYYFTRIGANRWGYGSISLGKYNESTKTESIIKELRLKEDGTFYPNATTSNLGDSSNPWNMVYANYISCKSADGSHWRINVGNDGSLSTTKI